MAEQDRQLAGPSSSGPGVQEPRAAKSGYQPTPEERQLIGRVEQRVNYTHRESARWALERQMFESIAYFCMERGTPVLRADLTETPIGDLQVGDQLLAPDETAGAKWQGKPVRRWRVATVEATRASVRRCLRVTLESGRALIATPDHRVLTEPGSGNYARTREWRELGELEVGSLVVAGYRHTPQVLSPEERGWLGGFLDGEGTLRGITMSPGRTPMGLGAIAFGQNRGPVLDRARELLRRMEVGLSDPCASGDYECTTTYLHGGAQTAIRVLRQVPSIRLRAGLTRLVEAGDISALPLRTERIVLIEEAGSREVVDIQTSTGTFVANGYVVHNCGIQWIEYTEHSRRFTRYQAPSWMPTPVTNLIAPRIQRMVAALLRIEPQGRVRPNTNEPQDQQAAKVGERLVTHAYDVTGEDELRQKGALIAALTGTVIACDRFNPQAGRLLRFPKVQIVDTPATEPVAQCPGCQQTAPPEQVGQPCPTCTASGLDQTLQEGTAPKLLPDGTPARDVQVEPILGDDGNPLVDEVREGELQSTVRMLFNFYWDPKATSLKDARWCGEAAYVDLDWLDENFPQLGPYVSAESGIDAANFYESSLLALIGPSIQGSAHYGGAQFFQNGAVARYYEERPSQKYPRGLALIVANGVLLYRGDLPITDEQGVPTGDLSYTEFKQDEVPGRFAGRTAAEDMVPLQRRFNGIDAQLILNQKTLLSPWIMAPKGSGLNPGQVYLRPGATVLYNFIGVGATPQVVQGQPLPQQIVEAKQACVQFMNELAEDIDANQPQQPGMRSGIALNLGKELGEEMKVPRRKRWALWVKERDRKRLLLMQRYYREARAVKVMGAGSEYQVQYWKGADLLGNTDVTVDPGSLVPRSPTIKAQTAFDALDAGLIDIQDPRQKQKLLELLGLPDFEPVTGPDQRRAEAENAALDAGTMPQVQDTDDHDTHLAVHVAAIKDPSFDSKPPDVQRAFHMHLQAHQQAVAAAQKADQADQAKQQRQAVKEQVAEEATAERERLKLGLAPGPPNPEANPMAA